MRLWLQGNLQLSRSFLRWLVGCDGLWLSVHGGLGLILRGKVDFVVQTTPESLHQADVVAAVTEAGVEKLLNIDLQVTAVLEDEDCPAI